MNYVYIDTDGNEIRLSIRSRSKGVTVFEQAVDELTTISAQEWVSDVLSHIAVTGGHPQTALDHVVDQYSKRYAGNYVREPIPRQELQRCVAYFEELREDAIAESEDSSWATEKPFTETRVLGLFRATLAD